MIFKAIDNMGSEALITDDFKKKFKKQLQVSNSCEDFYFGSGNKIDLLIGARTCENIVKIASPKDFGYSDSPTSPNIKLAKISIFPDNQVMVMGSLGIFKKIIDSSPAGKIDLTDIKLLRPKKISY